MSAAGGSGNPLTDERAMFSVLLRVLGIAGVVLIFAKLIGPLAGALAGLLLIGVWIGLVLSRRRAGERGAGDEPTGSGAGEP